MTFLIHWSQFGAAKNKQLGKSTPEQTFNGREKVNLASSYPQVYREISGPGRGVIGVGRGRNTNQLSTNITNDPTVDSPELSISKNTKRGKY